MIEHDSYNGHWEPRRKAEEGGLEKEVPVGQWPMACSYYPTLTVRAVPDGYVWLCNSCHKEFTTTTFSRPKHACAEDMKAYMKRSLRAS